MFTKLHNCLSSNLVNQISDHKFKK